MLRAITRVKLGIVATLKGVVLVGGFCIMWGFSTRALATGLGKQDRMAMALAPDSKKSLEGDPRSSSGSNPQLNLGNISKLNLNSDSAGKEDWKQNRLTGSSEIAAGHGEKEGSGSMSYQASTAETEGGEVSRASSIVARSEGADKPSLEAVGSKVGGAVPVQEYASAGIRSPLPPLSREEGLHNRLHPSPLPNRDRLMGDRSSPSDIAADRPPTPPGPFNRGFVGPSQDPRRSRLSLSRETSSSRSKGVTGWMSNLGCCGGDVCVWARKKVKPNAKQLADIADIRDLAIEEGWVKPLPPNDLELEALLRHYGGKPENEMPLFPSTDPPSGRVLAAAKRVGVSLPPNSFLKNGTLEADEYAPIRLAAKQSKKSFNSGERGTSRWKDNRKQRLKWLHADSYLVHWDMTHNPPWARGMRTPLLTALTLALCVHIPDV